LIAKRDFPSTKRPDWLCGPPRLQFNGYRSLFLGLKRQGLDVNNTFPSIAEVMNGWSFTSNPTYIFLVWTGVPLILGCLNLTINSDYFYK
jgi:hypothetical protein